MKKLIIIFAVLFLFSPVKSQDISGYLLKARALSSTGKPEMAAKALSEALLGSGDYRLNIARADAYELTGDYSAALSDLNEANKKNPGSGEYGLARIYALKGDVQTSLYHLELNLNSGWKKSEKEIMLDPAFGVIENRSEWRNFWRKERYTDLEKDISDMEYYTSNGKNEDAGALLSEIRNSYPASDELSYSNALYQVSSGRFSEAVKSIIPLTTEKPGNEKYLRLLARAQEGSGNYAGASETYSWLLNTGIADAALLISRAKCYRKTGESDKAMQDIGRYLEYYPDNSEALSLAGKTEAVSGDNLKALEYFSKNLQLHPNDPELYLERGNSYLNARSWEWAIKDYSMSLDLKPGNSDVWFNRGLARLNSGKTQDACHDFRKALSMGNKKASEYINRNCIR
jgi:tetratricopeptide (TPR) repeat protein